MDEDNKTTQNDTDGYTDDSMDLMDDDKEFDLDFLDEKDSDEE